MDFDADGERFIQSFLLQARSASDGADPSLALRAC